MSEAAPLLKVSHIACRYDTKTIIPDLSFTLAQGSIACLLGPSGCGKTTALRAIAGFEPVHAGSIEMHGRVLSRAGFTLPPEQRRIGMVFQDYALFPHLKVRDNVAFGLRQLSRQQAMRIVDELLSLVQLRDYADSYPHQLSGGQQQRVALARALAPAPEILLLDEPFSNLDTELRRALSLEVRDILKQRNTSAILVTHDQAEAFSVADEIGVMLLGNIQQWDAPKSLFHTPRNRFVASFICNGRFIPGQVLKPGQASSLLGELEIANIGDLAAGTTLAILVRPWQVSFQQEAACRATIVEQQFNGPASLTSLRLADGQLLESSDERLQFFEPGQEVGIQARASTFMAYPA